MLGLRFGRQLLNRGGSVVALAGFVVGACAPQPAPSVTAPAPPRRQCTYIVDATSLSDCKAAAAIGDADAALRVGDHYSNQFGRDFDGREGVEWYRRALELGNWTAYRKLFDAYLIGSGVPADSRIAAEYLTRAIAEGAEWAQLVAAREIEKSEPRKSAALYLAAARNDNCYAQARLAKAYSDGDIVRRNPAQAYFWMLLAQVGGPMRTSEYHPLARLTDGGRSVCPTLSSLRFELERVLGPDGARTVQSAATAWRKGQREPTLSLAAATPGTGAASGSFPRWVPLPMITNRLSAVPQEAPKIFELASPSVWIVAAPTSLGSAVAITANHLLTNCHVVQNRPLVWVKHHEVREQARVVAGDAATDRCVLEVPTSMLSAVSAIRGYDDLKVGEEVYTIGAPRGLELTLGQGIISGLRQQRGRRLIQTTAQISPGSSGGGLFDRAGNLIGITTFILRESEGLNFAIAAEDYFR